MADASPTLTADMVDEAFAKSALSADELRALIAGAEATSASGPDLPGLDEESEAGSAAPAAQEWGFDIEEMNRQFALVLMGSKAVVVREMTQAKTEDRVRILAIDAFRAYFGNKFTQVTGADGKIRTITWADRWLRASARRQYDGIEFHPDRNNAGGTPGYLNLWRGFSVEPKRGAG